LLNRQKQSPAGHNSSSSSSGGEPCAICFEDFAPDDDVKQLPCAHFYHCGCIDEWLVSLGGGGAGGWGGGKALGMRS
jgi:hypothetical protein